MAGNRNRYVEAVRSGHAYCAWEQWQNAIRAFGVASKEFPKEPEPYAGLGEAYFGLRKYDRALQAFKLAARYSRGDFEYLERVADLQERLGQLSDAAQTYAAAGELLLRQRQLGQAVYNWERAVRLDPGHLAAQRRLAMVNQRQDNAKAAVRHYLAIARILQMRGEDSKAMQMCRAALRLDPDNKDALLAMQLIEYGERALTPEPKPAPPPPPPAPPPPPRREPEEVEMETTVREIAAVFEEERQRWQREQRQPEPEDPVARATRYAQDALADEILREEDDTDIYLGGADELSKLERDALIGQAIDFQSRGDVDNAVICYERAMAGGLKLPAAYFALGVLYHAQGRTKYKRAALAKAARDPAYREAIGQLL